MVYFFILLFTASAHAENIFQSVTGSFITVSSESQLQNMDKEEVLTFKPNVSTGFGFALETEYIAFGYAFSGKDAQYKEHEKSKYRDLLFNFKFRHFDFRLNYQSYRGAVVDHNGRSEFYKDYEVKSKNGRFHYYLNDEHLDYIREGEKLVRKAASNQGFNTSKSWFFGLNLDARSIALPEQLVPEHQREVDENNIKYDRSFSAVSAGPLAGFDGMFYWNSFYLRTKLAGGPAFQTGGGTVSQFEFAFNTGFSFKKNHLIGFGADAYVMSFKDSDQRINNNNALYAFNYTYAFR